MSVSVFQYDYINLSAQCSTGVQCYLCTYPIWQTFCPEEEAPDSEGDAYRRFRTLCRALSHFDYELFFTSDNGLTPLVFTDIQQYFLAFAVYDDTLEPLIQQGEGPAYRLRDSDAAACLRQLLWDAVYTRTEAPAQLPPEEPIILKLGDERQLSFWPDSDLTLLKNWGAVQYYHGGGSLAQLCLEAARAAG